MSSKKSKTRQPTDKQIRASRSKLKSMGLLSKRVDLRKKPTTYQKKLIERYKDVLTGKAKVIDTASKAQAKGFKASYTVVGDKIIVPVKKGEKISFNQETGELQSTRKFNGKKITKTIADGELAPLGPGQYYVIPFGGGQRFRTNDIKTLKDFMYPYEVSSKPYKDWRKYVEIETIEDAEENTVSLTTYKRERARKRRKKKTR